MADLITRQQLQSFGLNASIISAAVVVAAGFYVYKVYLETELVNLQIKKLKKELNILDTSGK